MRRLPIVAACALILVACGSTPPATPSGSSAVPTAVSAIISDATSAPAAEAPTTAPAPTDAPAPTEAPTAAPAAEPGLSRTAPLPIGTEVRGTGWSITVTGVKRGKEATDLIKAANQFNDPPVEGMEYLVADLKVANIGAKPEAQMPDLGVDIRVTGDRNVLYSRTPAVAPKPFKDKLLPKGESEGQIVFTVPSDEKNLMFRVGELLSFDDATQRYIAIDEGAKLAPPADLASVAMSEAGKTKEAPAKVGDVVTTGAYEVKVLEFVRGEEAAAKIKEANEFNQPAPAGMEFVAIKVHVRALSTEKPDATTNVDSSLFKISGEKNVEYDHPPTVAPEPRLDANLYPGGEAEGWVVLAAATGEKGLVVKMAPLLSFSGDDARYIALS